MLGNMETTVGGTVLETFKAAKTTLIAGTDTVSAGSDLHEVVGHDRLTYVNNKLITTVEGGGAVPPPAPGNVAILWDAVNGGIESVTGKKGIPTAKQSQQFVNYAGDFNVAVPATGKVQILSSGPDSVLLGADGSATDQGSFKGHVFNVTPSMHHVCMWEEFERVINAIMSWADSHTHLSAMGPTGPAMAAPTGPMTASVKPTVLPVKSTRVLVGG